MQNHLPSLVEARANFALAAPDCPVCKSGMRFVQATPIVFSPALVDVSYACDECGQRTRRTLKRT
jgi:C4-type Zn-finger protein